MVYQDNILLTSTNAVAIAGTMVYGISVTPASFDPPCDAYAPVAGQSSAETYLNAYAVTNGSVGGDPAISTAFSALSNGRSSPYSVDLYVS